MKTYNDMIAHATEHNLEVRYNATVEGTPFMLTAHIPALNVAFVSGPVLTKGSDKARLNEKMRTIQKVTGIKNLMVFLSE